MRIRYGVLLTDTRGAAWKVGENDTVNGRLTSENQLCCGTRSTLCSRFYKFHPSDTCDKYHAVQTVLFWGNPHKELADDTFYIFNGLGEYHMIKDLNNHGISVQGRTTQIPGVNITRFTAFAFMVGLHRIEIHLKMPTDIRVYLNSSQLYLGNSSAEWSFHTINQQLSLVFKDGVTIQVSGRYQLLLSVTVPTTFGNVLHDNGLTDVYSQTNKTELLLEEETWRLKQNTSSIFDYSLTNNLNFDALQDRAFTPKHFTNLTQFLEVLFNNNQSVITQAKSACDKNTACFVRYKLSGNTSQSTSLKDEQTKQEDVVSKRKNSSPPEFVNMEKTWRYDLDSMPIPKLLNVSSQLVTSSDLEITVESSLQNYSFNSSTRQFTWNLTRQLRDVSNGSPSPLTFVVRDTKHNLTGRYTPNIVFCGCDKSSQCMYKSAENMTKMSKGIFYQVECNCYGSTTGRFCEVVGDVCKMQCYLGSTCNASSSDHPCLACPAGLQGDGIKCYDEDECLHGTARCDQTCENTVGGFVCKCMDGYNLINKTHCADINECDTKSSCPCMANNKDNKYCINTAGSCRCGCRAGFKGDNCTIAVSHVYGGKLVFGQVEGSHQVWSSDLENKNSQTFKRLATLVGNAIRSVFEKNPHFILVTVTKFELISLSRSRRKRAVRPEDYIAGTYELAFNTSVSSDVLNNTFQDGFDSSCKPDGKSCVFGENKNNVIAVYRMQSDVRDTYDRCASDDNNDCNDASTQCRSYNGTFSCECRAGYRPWTQRKHVCEDIDECVEYADKTLSVADNLVKLCGKAGTRCVNVPGNYTCSCDKDYQWMGPSDKCQLANVCGVKKPCKNGATCLNIADANGYACKCAFGWTGQDCNTEHEEAKKLNTTIIAVSASLGGFAFILIIILLCCWCRRNTDKDDGSTADFQITTHSEPNIIQFHSDEFKRSSKIPRPSVRLHAEPESNLEMVEHGSKANLLLIDEEHKRKERQNSYDKVTVFDHKTLSDHYDNPAYMSDENSDTRDLNHSH
ncbi:uncharacterized protein LOC121385132 [Gigantopelta aegis]|uniref:uncharacterized protein LOC121385132 n=1 Tax=Gigantopelta aegis TaxID=1735272 RepID=UPI001B88AF2A|nr:uncharacterized protein LOC121385132 [Gigantopelta aegis]